MFCFNFSFLVMEVRKRTHVETSPTISVKRARYDYLCIESDDFLSSSDYESVNSLQDKETGTAIIWPM